MNYPPLELERSKAKFKVKGVSSNHVIDIEPECKSATAVFLVSILYKASKATLSEAGQRIRLAVEP